MPIVRVVAKATWLPADGVPRSARHCLTRELVEKLRLIVAEVISYSGAVRIPYDEVILVPELFHPWAENAPDVWVDIQPDGSPDSSESSKAWRFGVATDVVARIRSLLEESMFNGDGLPSVDVECRPINGSGVSVDPDGEVTLKWGQPRSSLEED